MPFISGEQGNKSLELKGTGEQMQFWGTGNIENQDRFWGTKESNIFFSGEQGNKYPPWEGLINVCLNTHTRTHAHTHTYTQRGLYYFSTIRQLFINSYVMSDLSLCANANTTTQLTDHVIENHQGVCKTYSPNRGPNIMLVRKNLFSTQWPK